MSEPFAATWRGFAERRLAAVPSLFGADVEALAAVSYVVEEPSVALLAYAAEFGACGAAFGSSAAGAPRGWGQWVGRHPRDGQVPSFCGGVGVSRVVVC